MCHQIKNQDGFFMSYKDRVEGKKYVIGLKEMIIAKDNVKAAYQNVEYEKKGEGRLGIIITNRKPVQTQPVVFKFEDIDGIYFFAEKRQIRAAIHVSHFRQFTRYRPEEEYEKRIEKVLADSSIYSVPYISKNDIDTVERVQVYCMVDTSKIVFFDGESVSTSEFIVPKADVIRKIIAKEIASLEDKKEELESVLEETMEEYQKIYQKIEKVIKGGNDGNKSTR